MALTPWGRAREREAIALEQARTAAAALAVERAARSAAEWDAAIARTRSTAPTRRELGQFYGSNTFDAADFNRLLGDWRTTRIAPDDEIRWALLRLRTRARDLEKNNGVIRHFLRMLHINVVGPKGFTHSAQVRNNSGDLNEPMNERLEDAFAEWSLAPTIEGTMSFNSTQRLALKTVARDGECFVRLWRGFDNPFGFALELIDADLVDELLNAYGTDAADSSIRMGVEVDQYRRPSAYHIWNRPELATGYGAPRERLRIPADQIIHLYDPDRVGQTRGPSWLMAAMVPVRHLGGYIESELVASRIGAAKMGFFKRVKDGYGGALPEGDGQNAPAGGFAISADPGAFGVLPEGYELDPWSPDHPSTAFAAFVKTALRLTGTGLGASYNSLANDLEGVNYSSMRSGLLVERDYWKSLQDWWRGAFLRPVYREWLRMAMLSGAVKLDTRDFRKFTAAKFAGRGWPWVDPLKDTQAAILAVQSGLGSRTEFIEEEGGDVEETFETLAAEKKLAEQFGLTIDGPQAQTLTKGDTESEGGTADDEEQGVKAGGADGARHRNGVNGDAPKVSLASGGRRF